LNKIVTAQNTLEDWANYEEPIASRETLSKKRDDNENEICDKETDYGDPQDKNPAMAVGNLFSPRNNPQVYTCQMTPLL
jgi:hypothetical protein